MLIAHEAPFAILEKVQKVTDFDYALVHLFEQYPAYFGFFKRAIRDGRIVYLDNCLDYYTKVRLADGTMELLGKIVKKKLESDVLTVNMDTGCYESKKVTGWFEGRDRQTEWYKVIAECAKHNKRGGIVSTRCTEDHKFWAVNRQEWVPCKLLKPGDSILYNEESFNEVQKQLVLGSFLGDGSLAFNAIERGVFSCAHSDLQKPYIELKRRLLAPYCTKHYQGSNTKAGFNKRNGAELYGVSTRHLLQLSTLAELTEIKRPVPITKPLVCCKKQYASVIRRLSPIGLAFWYMDDGSVGKSGCSIHLSKESLEEQEQLLQALKETFDLEATVHIYGICNSDIRLTFNAVNARKLHACIAPYILREMQYKLFSEFQHPLTFWDQYDYSPTNKPIEVSISKVEKLRRRFKKYNIQVQDNHNFFADNLLVSNSIFELGTAFSADRYAYWINQLRPQYYVVPDVLEHASATIENFESWLQHFSHVPGQRVGVVQGKTYEDIVACYRYMASRANVVAISFDYSLYETLAPSINKYTSWMLGRVIVLNRLLKDGIIDQTKPHHLLGCGNPNEFSFYRDDTYSWIYSLDTSVPVVHGIFEQSYEYGVDVLSWRKERTKLADLLETEVTPAMLRIVLNNIETFKRLVH